MNAPAIILASAASSRACHVIRTPLRWIKPIAWLGDCPITFEHDRPKRRRRQSGQGEATA
jgi:hypothetical protein